MADEKIIEETDSLPETENVDLDFEELQKSIDKLADILKEFQEKEQEQEQQELEKLALEEEEKELLILEEVEEKEQKQKYDAEIKDIQNDLNEIVIDFRTEIMEQLDESSLADNVHNEILIEKLDALIEKEVPEPFITEADHVISIYGLIIIPGLIIIYALYKMISPFLR